MGTNDEMDTSGIEAVGLVDAIRAHGEPVVLALPPDLDAGLRDALIDEARANPSVLLVDYRRPEPLHRAFDFHAIGQMEATLATDATDATDWSVYLPAPKRWPGSPASSRTKTPKPPAEVQDAIQAAAEDRRDRKRVRNLRNVGHSADCAMDMAIGHRPCSCARAWLGDVRRGHDHKQEGASNE